MRKRKKRESRREREGGDVLERKKSSKVNFGAENQTMMSLFNRFAMRADAI